MARLDAEVPITRAELEETLRAEGFRPQNGAEHVWWSQDRTKFVCFPDADSGEAIYGDSEIGEPGKTIPIATAHRIVRGELLLESPLGVSPVQPRNDRALAGQSTRPRLRANHIRALPAAQKPIEAIFEEDAPPEQTDPDFDLDKFRKMMSGGRVEPPEADVEPIVQGIDPEKTWQEYGQRFDTTQALRSPPVLIAFGAGVGVAVSYLLSELGHPMVGLHRPLLLVAILSSLGLLLFFLNRRRRSRRPPIRLQ